jgi:translation initiation factor eIF-2B subunit delta
MIPPPRHLSDNLILHARQANYPRRAAESITVGGSNSDAPVSPAPSSSYSSRFVVGGDRGFFDGKGKDNGKVVASSFPRGGFDLTALKGNAAAAAVPASQLTTVSVVNDSLGIPGERFFRF